MDLLDNITSMMTSTGNERFGKPKPRKEVKTESVDESATTSTAPTSSFRIPKKKPGGAQPSTTVSASASPLSRSDSSSSSRPESRDRSRHSNRMDMDDKGGVREVFKTEPRDYGGRTFKQEYKPSFGAGTGMDEENTGFIESSMTSGEFVIPRKVDIEMNGLQLDLSAAPEFVNRYHINITLILKNKEKDATKGPREDLPTQHRRRALFAVFRQLVKSNPEAFGDDRHKHVYDLGNTFYSVGCSITQEHGDCVFRIPADKIKSEFSRKFLSKGGLKELVITVQWTGQVYIKGSKQNEDDGTRREAARFFDVLTSQILFHGGFRDDDFQRAIENDFSDHHMFGNKFFEKHCDNDVRLGEGKCVKSGFEKNVRFLGDSEECAAPVLQIDTKKSPFYSEQSVLDFIREITGRNPPDALSQKSLKRKVARELRDLVVTATHTGRDLYVHGITENDATNQFFTTNEGEMSVEKYFYHQYHMELKHPKLPLATERKGASGFCFYPLEVLMIQRGQRVDNRKLAGPLTDKMIQQARMLPHEMREHNKRQLEEGRLTDRENVYLHAFGVHAADNFITCEAKVLSAPEIKYKTDSLLPDRSGPMLSWRLNPRFQFHRPAEVKSVSVAVFDRAMSDQQALEFYRSLAHAGRARGMVVQDASAKVVQLPSEVDEITEEHFRSCVGKVSMILCITKIKKDDVHDTIKMLEAKHGILTQHVSRDTAMACIRGGKTLENVLLKFNAKNGGLNHTVGAPRQALGGGTTQKDMNGRLFHGKMFVGFELSHAAAQCLYDRQNAATVKEPTVVGFSYSMGEPTDYCGFWWYQQPRLHTVQYINIHFARAFISYHKKNKRLPAEVFVYRSGTSEGEFSEVTEEANEIRAVAEKMSDLNNGRPYRPKITVVVAQTNSNYRIMPASLPPPTGGRLRAQDLNVPSGTCADSVIVHPRYREFILTSQQANIGTSRPTRYTIVCEDKPHMSVDDAEHITHFLCHGHQQSTLPTHVPAVLYAAENLAKRGRAAWKSKINENSDGASSSGSHRISLRDGESPEDFYERISQELMNSLPNHYFA